MASSDSAKPSSSPMPRSPPKTPDLSGKHRKRAELQIMHREIGFLEEELQSLEAIQPASRCCKEIDEFVGTNPDPLVPLNLKVRRSSRFWKWLCSKSLCYFSWICCSSGCSLHIKQPQCSCNPLRNCQCSFLKCCCCCLCCSERSSFKPRCVLPNVSCHNCCSCSCWWSCSRCRKVRHCSKCTKNCFCLPCFLCS